MEGEKPLISIVIPIYNVELYLRKCIDSVLNQTYINLEVILVDDGATDSSPQICDEYAKKDSRVTVIHKENGGLSDARNVGIDNVKGEYITFIDSDDFVKLDYIEYLYNLIRNHGADLSVCNIIKIYEDEFKKEKIVSDIHSEYSSQEATEKMMYQKMFDTSACAKLYKIKLFKGTRYPKDKYYEDLATTYKLFNKCSKIVHGTSIKYTYILRKNSITTSVFTSKRMELIEIAQEMLDFISVEYPDIKKAAISRFVSANFQILLQTPKEKNQFKEDKKKIINNIKRYRKIVLFDKNTRVKNKVAVICSYFGVPFARFVYSLIK